MMNDNMFLREPNLEDKEEILKMCDEGHNCSDEIKFEGATIFSHITDENYEKWLERINFNKLPKDENYHYVPQTSYILVDDNNHIYGAFNLRHYLKGSLFKSGGHIGYWIRPSERGKGLAAKGLILVLENAHMMGIDKVLLTCDQNNIASIKTIERCYGIYSGREYIESSMTTQLQYWIDIKYTLNKMKENSAIKK